MKSFYLFVAFISLLLLAACGSNPKNNQVTDAAVEDTLSETTEPIVSDGLPKETAAVIVKDAPPEVIKLPIVKEKLPKGIKPCWEDSILVSKTRLEAVSTLGNMQITKGKGFDNYLYRGSGKGVSYERMMNDRNFKVYVDTTQTVAIEDEKETTCKAYPVFLVNETKRDLYLNLEDGKVTMIQEAKDENGNWQPIEEWWYSDCGNSDYMVTFRPRKVGMTRIRQYDGSFETELRVKIGTGTGDFIYSHTFRGRINKSQLADATAFAKKYPKLLYDPRQP